MSRKKIRTIELDPYDKSLIESFKIGADEYANNIPAWAKNYLYTKPFSATGDCIKDIDVNYLHDVANMLKILNLPGKSKILDVACGPGWLSEFLYRYGYEVTGIDISQGLLQIAQERIDSLKYPPYDRSQNLIKFKKIDIETEYLEEKFDAIIFYDCLHHFCDINNIIDNSKKMLAPGGKILIKEGAMPPEGSEGESLLIEESQKYKTLESPFDHTYLMDFLRTKGFEVIQDFFELNGFFEKNTNDLSKMLKLFGSPYQVNIILCQQKKQEIKISVGDYLWRASISLIQWKEVIRAEQRDLALDFNITNLSDCIWWNDPQLNPGSVALGIKIYDHNNTMVEEYLGRTPLPKPLDSNDVTRISIIYPLSNLNKNNKYKISVDMVLQGYFWMEEKGSKPLIKTILWDNDKLNLV
jgi:SAM-dependent methyltransferase